MKKSLSVLLASLLSVWVFSACSTPAPESAAPDAASVSVAPQAEDLAADIYFENGIVYTVDDADTVTEALAVKDGKIVFVGSAADGQAYKDVAAEVVDLDGGMLLPGFIDSHIHIASPEFFDFSLAGITNVDETMDTIAAYVAANPEKESYLGFGYMTSMFEGDELANGPKKERLDEISPEKPLIVASFDGHAMWLNSAALEAAGITADSVPPPGGLIVHDKATGALWGTLKDSAMSMVQLPTPGEEQLLTALENYNSGLNALGYTSIMAMPGNGFSPVPWAGLSAMEKAGDLTLRVHGGAIVTGWNAQEDLVTLAQLRDTYNSELVRLTTAKLFADGVMDSESAHLLEAYDDNPDSFGATDWQQDTLNEAVASINELGIQAHTHAIGDAATHMALDAYEYARDNTPEGDYRNTITHLQLVADEDYARFAELDVIAVPQPYWHFKQPDYWMPIEAHALGERAENEYPMQSFLDVGVTMAYASDYPVTTNPNPFIAIETAVTRNLADSSEYGVDDITDMDDPAYLLWPEQRVTVQDAIRGFTASGAYAMFAEEETGSLEVGKSADLIVIDRDILTIDPLTISDTVVLQTYLRGVPVYIAA